MSIEMDGVDINYRRSKERVEIQLDFKKLFSVTTDSVSLNGVLGMIGGIITSMRGYKANIRKKPYTFL